MIGPFATEYDSEFLRYAQRDLASGDELDPDIYPRLDNLSAGFLFEYVYRPISPDSPEFVYVPFETYNNPLNGEDSAKYSLSVTEWNWLWESRQLRAELFEERLHERLSWLNKFTDCNLYLLPHTNKPRYDAYSPLFHLLPQRTLNKYHLPLLKKGIWPAVKFTHHAVPFLQLDFELRLSKAFAHHVWPLLISGSRVEAFSRDDPIVLLSHNLDYWLPFIYTIAEERLRSFPRVKCESSKQELQLRTLQKELPSDSDVTVDRPLCGGSIWAGEQDAWEATKQLVEVADRDGKLRGIIEAVRTNRVEDDFSKRWSFAKEDFERKLYSKRSKVKISFVQLDDTMPVHGPDCELVEDLLWEDFIALLDRKERQVVVCLRNGVTKVGEVSKILGYANHSPVSKTLARIRQKAKQYFELD
jgi:hypothetical protein